MFKISIAIGKLTNHFDRKTKSFKAVDEYQHARAVAHFANLLRKRHGGATITETRGVWRDAKRNITVFEDSTTITAYSEKELTRNQKRYLNKIAARYALTLSQDSIMLAVEDCGGSLDFVAPLATAKN